MARRSAAKVDVNPASPREAREWLRENEANLPEGVTVGVRGRLSNQALAHFTEQTGRPVVAPVAAEAAAE